MEYDLVLFGATGYTGQLCAKYLAATYSSSKKTDGEVRWAIAGRSRQRLEAMRAALSLSCDVVFADTGDRDSIDAMARQARCVANLVGPYLRLGGEVVVEACVRNGTCYVDLTGETAFYATLVDKYHEAAQRTGAIIVPSAGFDSVPGELTAYLAARALQRSDPDDDIVDAYAGISTFGWFSSGTLESIIVMASEGRGDMVRSNRADWLSPARGGPRQQNKFQLARYHSAFARYGAWLFFAPHNTRVAYRAWGLARTAADAPVRYSDAYQYQEAIVTPLWLLTVVTSIAVKLFTQALVLFPLLRAGLSAVLPRNGGPPDIINTRLGFMDVRTVVTTQSGRTAVCRLYSRGDPG